MRIASQYSIKRRKIEERRRVENCNWLQIQTLTEEGWRNLWGILERPSSLEESCDPPKPRFSRMVSGSSFLDSRKLSTPALEALEAAESEAKEATRSPLLKASRRLSCTSHTSSSGCCGLSNKQKSERALRKWRRKWCHTRTRGNAFLTRNADKRPHKK
jgi:hypothetical protein